MTLHDKSLEELQDDARVAAAEAEEAIAELRLSNRQTRKLLRGAKIRGVPARRLRRLRRLLRRGERIVLEHDHGAGAVLARRCLRGLGSLRVLYRPGTQMEADDGWLVICNDHSSCVHTPTRYEGERAMAATDWCADCQKGVSD